MRILTSILLLLLLSCNSSWPERIKNYTAKVFNGDSFSIAKATKEEYLHSFILYPDSVHATINSVHTNLKYDSVSSYILRNKTELNSQTLNLIVTKGVGFKLEVDILDQMTLHHIKNFKLLRYN